MTQAADDPAALSLSLHNAGIMRIQIALQPTAYAQAQPREQLQLAGGQTWQRSRKAAASGGWYDLWIEHDGAHQRLAGRVETGADSVSDPAMGGAARLYQDDPVAIGALG